MNTRKMVPLTAISAVLAATVSVSAQAGMALGGSAGSARVNGGDFDGSDTGWKVYAGGYGRFIGGEIGYVDFGQLGGNGPDAHAWAPAITAGVPLGATTLYGKFGAAFADVEGSSIREEYSDEAPFYGVGARIGAANGLGLRLEYERYELDRDDVDQALVGLEFRFQ